MQAVSSIIISPLYKFLWDLFLLLLYVNTHSTVYNPDNNIHFQNAVQKTEWTGN